MKKVIFAAALVAMSFAAQAQTTTCTQVQSDSSIPAGTTGFSTNQGTEPITFQKEIEVGVETEVVNFNNPVTSIGLAQGDYKTTVTIDASGNCTTKTYYNGQVTSSTTGLVVGGASNPNAVIYNNGGTTSDPGTVTVAPGVNGTDAVNVDQLNTAITNLTNVTNQVAADAAFTVDPATGQVRINTGTGNAGETTTGAQGVNFTAGDGADSVLSGVAAGVADTDAVNVSQLEQGLADTLDAANDYTDTKIGEVNNRITTEVTRLDTRIDNVDARVTTVDNRVTTLDNRVTTEVDRLDTRIDNVDARVTTVDNRVTALDNRVTTEITRVDTRIDDLKVYTDNRITYAIDSSNDYTDQEIAKLDNKFSNLAGDLKDQMETNRGIAAAGIAGALAAVQSQGVQQHPGEFVLGVGIGNYDKATSGALSFNYLSKSGKAKFGLTLTKGNNGGKVGTAVGGSFAF